MIHSTLGRIRKRRRANSSVAARNHHDVKLHCRLASMTAGFGWLDDRVEISLGFRSHGLFMQLNLVRRVL